MPKEFDPNELGFSSGYLGSKDSSSIEYNVDGNTYTSDLLAGNDVYESNLKTTILTIISILLVLFLLYKLLKMKPRKTSKQNTKNNSKNKDNYLYW